jgi:hypothetical protein
MTTNNKHLTQRRLLMKLTSFELSIVISRFETSMYNLKQSEDYPERNRDEIIRRKLLDELYEVTKKEIADDSVNLG